MPQLAPYACDPLYSKGRLHEEKEDPTRSVFRRDCDRIIHSTAFRRLEYKTQVFVNHEGDHFRTRLTHSLEVAQIARSICRLLKLNEDLGESLAIAHDLGHTPFGHAGEEALNEVMKDFGGFSHNTQTLKILTKLEHRYATFDGLNLTWEALEGLVKHNGPLVGEYRNKERYDGKLPRYIAEYNEKQDLKLDTFPSAEAQVASLADDIAYNNHDIDDGLRAGLFTLEALTNLPFVGDIFREVATQYPATQPQRLIHESIRRMINLMIKDVVEQTLANITAWGITSTDHVRYAKAPVVAFSPQMEEYHRVLKRFLMKNMYRHYKVCRMTVKAQATVKDLFTLLYEKPNCLPPEWYQAVEAKIPLTSGDAPLNIWPFKGISHDEHKAYVVADFIAGMTDRFAIEEHRRLYDMGYKG